MTNNVIRTGKKTAKKEQEAVQEIVQPAKKSVNKKATLQEPVQQVTQSTFKRIAEWNFKAGNFPQGAGTAAYWNNITNQAKRIEEELVELYTAINEKNIEGVVDAGADLDVVVSGLNYLSGCDYPNVINTVLRNNDLKVNTDKNVVEQWKFYWDANGVPVYIAETEFEGTTYYCLRREEDGKILKYANFPKVDLSSFLPQLVAEGYTLYKDREVEESEESLKFPSLYLTEIDDQGGVLAKVLEENNTDKVLLVIVNGQLTEVKLFPEVDSE